MTGQSTAFLVNPASAGGSTGTRWPEIARRAADARPEGDTLFSERPEHLRELARQAAAGGVELLVAVGGDGTVNEVVNGLAAEKVGRAGRDSARYRRGLRAHVRHPDEARRRDARCAHRRDRVRSTLGACNVPRVERRGAEACFANVASAGMSGAIAKRVNESKSRFAKASYFLATFAVFARWQTTDVRVAVDEVSRSARMRDVVVANCRYFGAGMEICPEAEPDDGLLRRAADRRRHQDRPRPDAAEDLPRDAPPPPQGRAVAGQGRQRRRRRAAAHPARRRAARDHAGQIRGTAWCTSSARPSLSEKKWVDGGNMVSPV